jgi:autotransporter-associated beta strand protein
MKRTRGISKRISALLSAGILTLLGATIASPLAQAADRYWDNNGGTANYWTSAANWSDSVNGGGTTTVPGGNDVANFSATPIQGAAQAVQMRTSPDLNGLKVLAGVTATTTLTGGSADQTITLWGSSIVNDSGSAFTIGSGTAGQRVHIELGTSQSIAANGSGNINIINNVTSRGGNWTLTNNGSGSGYVGMGPLQSTVGKIVQNSATSTLGLRANSSGFAGDVDILQGTVLIGTHANNLGGTSGQVNLGSSAVGATAAATLEINDNQNITYAAKPIMLGTTSGLLKIVLRDEGGGAYTHTIAGAVSGNNNLTIESRADGAATDDKLTFTGGLNNAGTITHIGDGAGDLTINSAIGANVTEVIQNSVTSKLVLTGNNTFTGPTTVSAGTLQVDGGSCLSDTARLTIASGTKVQLDDGVRETVKALYFGTAQQQAGTWGSTSSEAKHKDDTYFSGTGVLEVLTRIGTVVSVR